MPETENCGCPDGTFAYDITFPDIAGEPAPSLEEIEGRIASKFGLTGNDVFNAPRLSSASYYTHMDSPTDGVGDIRLYFEGDRLCLPGDSVVMGYTSPCNPPIEEIDVEMFFMLMELMDYAELLAVSASSNPDMVLNPAQYQLFQSGFVGEAAIQAYFLAFNLDYLDSDNPMISAAFGDINLRMGDAPWNISLASDANELDINAIIDLLGLLVDVAESEVGANDRSVQNAQCLITQYDQAIEQDSEFLERLEQARTSLEAWKPNAENDLVLLDSLLGKIDRMWENDILAGVWVGDIIQAFQRFHDNMQARHDLLSEMDASLERIDFLAMTPDQRINYARMEQIHYVLMNWGLTPCPFDMTTDWETFYACAVEAINMGLEAGNPGILTLIQPGNNGTAENYIDNLSHSITTDPYDDEVRQAEFERTMARTFFALGFVPVVGAFIDFVNALVALSQGNYSEAFWNFLFVAIDFDDFVRLGQRMGLLNGIADDFIQRADGELDEYVPILNDSRNSARQLEDLDDVIEGIYERIRRDADGTERATLRTDITESDNPILDSKASQELLDNFPNLVNGNIGNYVFGNYSGLIIDVSGADRDLIFNMLKKLDELVGRYPQASELIRAFVTKSNSNDFYAPNIPFDAFAAIVKRGEQFELWLSREVSNYGTFYTTEGLGKYPRTGIPFPGGDTINFDSLITHEFGHLLRQWLIRNNINPDEVLAKLRSDYDSLLREITPSSFGYSSSKFPSEIFAEVFAADNLIRAFDAEEISVDMLDIRLLETEYRDMIAHFMLQINDMLNQAGG